MNLEELPTYSKDVEDKDDETGHSKNLPQTEISVTLDFKVTMEMCHGLGPRRHKSACANNCHQSVFLVHFSKH